MVNAVSLWSLGGVIPAYIHIQDGGDQSAGRSICGLSPVDADFSILPPRFKVNATVNFADAVVGYETYPANFNIVIPYIIASVVHHRQFLFDNLPTDDPLFHSRFWINGLQIQWQNLILPPCRVRCQETGMVATGVPVSILSLELTERNHRQVLEMFQSIKQQSNTSQPYFATKEEMKELIHDTVSKAIAEERMREDVYSTDDRNSSAGENNDNTNMKNLLVN